MPLGLAVAKANDIYTKIITFDFTILVLLGLHPFSQLGCFGIDSNNCSVNNLLLYLTYEPNNIKHFI